MDEAWLLSAYEHRCWMINNPSSGVQGPHFENYCCRSEFLSSVWERLPGGGEGRVDCSSYWLTQTPHPWPKKLFVTWPLFCLPPMLQWPGSDGSFAHSFSKYWLNTYCVPGVWRHPNTELTFSCLRAFIPASSSSWTTSVQILCLVIFLSVFRSQLQHMSVGPDPFWLHKKKCPFIIIHLSNPFV